MKTVPISAFLPSNEPGKASQNAALQQVKDFFRPELLGRLDEVVFFHPLSDQQLCEIAEKMLSQLEERAKHQGYRLSHTPQTVDFLVGQCKREYGARELRKCIVRAVEQALADAILDGSAQPDIAMVADVCQQQIVLRPLELTTA